MENLESKISVILPVYNAEGYLHESLKSILGQEGVSFDVIAVDDGSTDNSWEILNSYDDPRIKIFRNQRNKGLIFTLNKAIKLTQAPYIARIDADDICLPDRFVKQFKFLEQNPHIHVLASTTEIIDKHRNKIGRTRRPIGTDEHLKCHFLFGNMISHPSVMIRRELFYRFQYDENYFIAEDFGLWATLLTSGFNIHIIDEPMICYRIHGSNISRSRLEEKHESIRKIIRLQMDEYGICYTSKELKIHVSLVTRQGLIDYHETEINQWLDKLYTQLVKLNWDPVITWEVIYYYFLSLSIRKHKKSPWKLIRVFLNRQQGSISSKRLSDRLRILSKVVHSKLLSKWV